MVELMPNQLSLADKRKQLLDLFVVIPALNEEKRIGPLVGKLIEIGFSNIIVVNDGSTDATAHLFDDIEEVTVIDHMINLGAGAATMTGIEYALRSDKAAYIATIDADHQHHPSDLKKLYFELKKRKLDLIIGSRFLKNNRIPLSRQFYNFVGNWISYLKSGHLVTDSQSGIKVISYQFAKNLFIEQNGFEYCIEIIKKAKLKNFTIGEHPVSVTYTPDTMQKGQSFSNGLMMLAKLLNPFQL